MNSMPSEVIEDIKAIFSVCGNNIADIRIFGSAVSGNYDEANDIDLFLIFKGCSALTISTQLEKCRIEREILIPDIREPDYLPPKPFPKPKRGLKPFHITMCSIENLSANSFINYHGSLDGMPSMLYLRNLATNSIKQENVNKSIPALLHRVFFSPHPFTTTFSTLSAHHSGRFKISDSHNLTTVQPAFFSAELFLLSRAMFPSIFFIQ